MFCRRKALTGQEVCAPCRNLSKGETYQQIHRSFGGFSSVKQFAEKNAVAATAAVQTHRPWALWGTCGVLGVLGKHGGWSVCVRKKRGRRKAGANVKAGAEFVKRNSNQRENRRDGFLVVLHACMTRGMGGLRGKGAQRWVDVWLAASWSTAAYLLSECWPQTVNMEEKHCE